LNQPTRGLSKRSHFYPTTHLLGAGVVSILNQFLEDAGALGVVAQNLADPGRQVDLVMVRLVLGSKSTGCVYTAKAFQSIVDCAFGSKSVVDWVCKGISFIHMCLQ
jgi:hypothetical protein